MSFFRVGSSILIMGKIQALKLWKNWIGKRDRVDLESNTWTGKKHHY